MINEQYKDATIKLFLKSDERRIIRLINYIRGTNYPEDTKLSENTLETPVYMEAHNDLSFCYDNELNLILIEHQSTINENMPVRMLMYLGRVYEKLTKSNKIYATRRISLPAPHCIVLYNGTAACPEVTTMKLSDAFGAQNQEVELFVRMYNINYDETDMPEILDKNPDLKEYSLFIHKAREYRMSGCETEEAVTKAIQEFRNTETMGPFLDENASEVLNMLMTEWDTNEFGKVQREEGRAEGRAEGIALLCKSISNLTKNAGKTFDEAVALLGLSEEEIAACRPHCQK